MKKKLPTPVNALKKIEKILRGTDLYFLAMNPEATLGLGKWIKLVIKANK